MIKIQQNVGLFISLSALVVSSVFMFWDPWLAVRKAEQLEDKAEKARLSASREREELRGALVEATDNYSKLAREMEALVKSRNELYDSIGSRNECLRAKCLPECNKLFPEEPTK
jgi:hypothetical protein